MNYLKRLTSFVFPILVGASLIIAPLSYALADDSYIDRGNVLMDVEVRVYSTGYVIFSNERVAGVEITFIADDRTNPSHGTKVTTDSDGIARARVYTGSYNIEARKDGYTPKDSREEVRFGNDRFNIGGFTRISGTSNPGTYDVSVRVIDGVTAIFASEIPGVEVTFIADDRTNPSHGTKVTTDSDGIARASVRAGFYNLEARKQGYEPKDLYVEVKDGSSSFIVRRFTRATSSIPGPTNTPTTSTNTVINENCNDLARYLNGTITDKGEDGTASATINNTSTGCTFKVTFASYQMYAVSGSDWISSQKLNDYETVNVGPGTTNLTINNRTDCKFQVDLVEGDVLAIPNYGDIGRYFLDYEFAASETHCAQSTPTPTTRNIISVTSPCVNERAMINGTNLSPTVQLFNSAGQRTTTLEGNTINASATEVSYLVPSGTPAGNYTLRVGPNLTDVSNTIGFVIRTCTSNSGLSIAKTVRNISRGTAETEVTTASPNETVEFTLVVSSNSTVANNVRVSDYLPGGLRYISNTTTINGVSTGDGIINSGLNIGNLNGSSTIRFRATLESEGYFSSNQQITNTATAYADNAGSVNDTARVDVVRNQSNNAFLSLNKLVRNYNQSGSEQDSVSARVGDTVEFVLQVTASGNQNVNNVRVSDYLPSGLRYISGSATLNGSFLSDSLLSSGVNIGSLYNNTSTIRFRATVENLSFSSCTSNTLTNSATVFGDNASSYTDTARVDVIRDNTNCNPANSNLTISKTVRNITRGDSTQFSSVSAVPGNTVDFTITVRNNGSGIAYNVIVNDNLPFGLIYSPRNTSIDGIITNDNVVTSGGLYIGNLNPGEQKVIRLFAVVSAGIGTVATNNVSVRADNTPSVTAQASVSVGSVAGALDVKTGAGTTIVLAIILGLLGAMIYYFGWDTRKWPVVSRLYGPMAYRETHFRV